MNKRLAIYATLTGFAFLVASVFNYFHHGQTSKIVPSLVQEIVNGFGLLWLHVALFLLAFALVHAVAGWLFAFLVQPPARKITGDDRESGRLVLLLFLIAVLWTALESGAQFPRSMLGGSFHEFAVSGAGYWMRLGAALVVVAALIVGAGMRIVQWLPRLRSAPVLHAGAGLVLILALAGWIGLSSPDARPFPNDPDRPHVILVGIDGWRLDTLPANGGMPGLMPFVEEFMDESAVIEETITPLARTFPAWWTVFTGQFPPTHGARFNLIDEQFIRTPLTLPQQLGERGYYRMFATDERRFANFREAHGFNRVAGPGIGAADFLLGGLNDAPLTNLLANTVIGRYLFPFTHANRAAYITYRPQTFDRLLERAIAGAPRQPLFLTVHYELPHWPFQWADGPTGEFAPHPLGSDYAEYMETLRLADRQVARLFGQLEALGILENAIVVLLSDHGEAFSEEQLDWHDPQTGRTLPTPVGHGTHVLGLTQHQIPLAFRRYGGDPLPAGIRPGRASLADIYPTLAEWLGTGAAIPVDGQSLLPILDGRLETIPARAIPVETGFNTQAMLAGEMSESRLLAEGAAYYRITRDGRLEIKPQDTEKLIANKQRAVIYENLIMALPGPDAAIPTLGDVGNRHLLDYETVLRENPDSPITAHLCHRFRLDMPYFSGPICMPAEGRSISSSGSRSIR